MSRLQNRSFCKKYMIYIFHTFTEFRPSKLNGHGLARKKKERKDIQFSVFILQDLLEYKKKLRILQIRTLDDANKKIQIDDSMQVGQLMVTICTKMGKV